jgi:MOSC domain-containing protein YiiM
MTSKETVSAVKDSGLVGDHHFKKPEHTGSKRAALRQVTLIEVESLEGVQRDYKIDLSGKESRRNIVTKSVPLNHLVDVTFQVGGALLRGSELCDPCAYLEKSTEEGVLKALTHRGGLCCEVIESGEIAVGDPIIL